MYKVKNLHTKKIPRSYGFTGEFYQSFKNKIILVPHKLFQKFEKKGVISVILWGQCYSEPKSDFTTQGTNQYLL